MRYLNTLYVRNHRARIRHRRGSLLLASPDGNQRVPLEAIDGVVLLGNAQMTTQALEACVRRGVRVAALRQGGSVRFVVGPATGGNVHLRTAQYRAISDEVHSLELSKAIVAAKLQNSRKVVDRWARDEKDPLAAEQLKSRARALLARVARVAEAHTPNHVRGVEGDAARVYFGAVRRALARCDFEFSSRTQATASRSGQRAAGLLLRPAANGIDRGLRSGGIRLPDGVFSPPPVWTPVTRTRPGRGASASYGPVRCVIAAAKSTGSTELRGHAGWGGLLERRGQNQSHQAMGAPQGLRVPPHCLRSPGGPLGSSIGPSHAPCPPPPARFASLPPVCDGLIFNGHPHHLRYCRHGR